MRDQNKCGVNVQCSVLEHHNGQSYLNFLENDSLILIDPLGIRTSMWYQHDGCPEHSSQSCRDFLNIERGSLFQCLN